MIRILWTLLLTVASPAALAGQMEEFKVKREAVYEFAQAPKVTRSGDHITIDFETKGNCDVTVAIEEEDGKILRHLASGVLGENAPPPFQKNVKKQALVWDGKDDRGIYLDNKDALTVRVSLGLKPQFERTLLWHPKKLGTSGDTMPFVVPQPEGVYVYDAFGAEQIRLFDHQGKYIQTIYPFAADRIQHVRGLEWREMPDGFRAPRKMGYWGCTFLTGGRAETHTGPGDSAHSFAVRNGKIAVLGNLLGRMASDGTSAGVDIAGPEVTVRIPSDSSNQVRPRSAAFSVDGRYLYLTGYSRHFSMAAGAWYAGWNNALYRVEYGKNEPPVLWKGAEENGKDPSRFDMPASVCVDSINRVYVADWWNDRVQVFSPEGNLLKSIPVNSPSVVQVHHKTGEIYVFSWAIMADRRYHGMKGKDGTKAMLRRLGPLEDPKMLEEVPLPLDAYSGGANYASSPSPFRAALDSWAEPPSIWLTTMASLVEAKDAERFGIRRFTIENGKLAEKQSFQREVIGSIGRWKFPPLARQRLYVNPVDGSLLVGEGDVGYAKAFTRLLRINPETGKGNEVELPMSSEDLAIDRNGHFYFRTTPVIARFDPATWREIPFDYGETVVARFPYGKPAELNGALILPSTETTYWHQHGMDVNAHGDIAVFCANSKQSKRRDGEPNVAEQAAGRPYTPPIYPGRYRYGELHIFDKYGKIKAEDAAMGLPMGHGVCMDAHNDLYVHLHGSQIVNGKTAFNEPVGTIVKFKPKRGKVTVSSGAVPVPLESEAKPGNAPNLNATFLGHEAWVEGFEWMYSGVGISYAGSCQCWNSRFALDFYGRVFAPENFRSQIAVLDTNGNLMLHVGRLGNVEDGRPLVPEGGPAATRLIGGDEVALMYANYVAVHSDHRLFIADPGNLRILSVKLGYHHSLATKLKDIVNSTP